MKGLERIEVAGDGSCQFRAFRWGLRRKGVEVPKVPDLRKAVAAYLLTQEDRFSQSVYDEEYSSWVKRVAELAWADHIILLAMADMDSCRIKVGAEKSERRLFRRPQPRLGIMAGFAALAVCTSLRQPRCTRSARKPRSG